MFNRLAPRTVTRVAAVFIVAKTSALAATMWWLVAPEARSGALLVTAGMVFGVGTATATLLWRRMWLGYLSAISLLIALAVLAFMAVLIAPRLSADALRAELASSLALTAAGVNGLGAYVLTRPVVRAWFE